MTTTLAADQARTANPELPELAMIYVPPVGHGKDLNDLVGGGE